MPLQTGSVFHRRVEVKASEEPKKKKKKKDNEKQDKEKAPARKPAAEPARRRPQKKKARLRLDRFGRIRGDCASAGRPTNPALTSQCRPHILATYW